MQKEISFCTYKHKFVLFVITEIKQRVYLDIKHISQPVQNTCHRQCINKIRKYIKCLGKLYSVQNYKIKEKGHK